MPERMSGRENSRSSPLQKSPSKSPLSSTFERKRGERSRTRSRSVRKYKNRQSRSKSRSISPRRRSYSRSPYNSRRRNERPRPCRCIGIFGLSTYTDENKIRDIFEKFGPIERVQMVIDAQSGRSRGFCFVYYDDVTDAKVAKEKCCGLELDGRHIRVDYSITQRPHTPTPGRYMGRTTRNYRESGDKRNGRSPSPNYDSRKRRYEKSRSPVYYGRSRSRSYSPRDRRRNDRRYR